MIHKSRVMLYVEDVALVSRFFVEQLKAEIVENVGIARGISKHCLAYVARIGVGYFSSDIR